MESQVREVAGLVAASAVVVAAMEAAVVVVAVAGPLGAAWFGLRPRRGGCGRFGSGRRGPTIGFGSW